jgi:DNA-binding response OmpR family regulator
MSVLLPESDLVRRPCLDSPTILIVDDEPLIRDMLARYLRAYNFRTVLARSGTEAVDIFRSRGHEIALVLLDIRMPGLSGPETLSALRSLDPHVRCCFMSGDLGNYSPEELRAYGALHLFAKPFQPQEMVAVLRRLTREKGGDRGAGL